MTKAKKPMHEEEIIIEAEPSAKRGLEHFMSDILNKFEEHFGRWGGEVKKHSTEGTEHVIKTIEEKPFKAVGIALVCGAAIGYLLGKK